METLRWAIIGAVAIIGIAISSAGADSKSAVYGTLGLTRRTRCTN